MSAKSHPSYDAGVIAPVLESLHEHITQTQGRIEITRRGSDERCVLISKQELVCLERALEILSNTEQVRNVAGQLAALAARSEEYAS